MDSKRTQKLIPKVQISLGAKRLINQWFRVPFKKSCQMDNAPIKNQNDQNMSKTCILETLNKKHFIVNPNWKTYYYVLKNVFY